MRTIFHCDIDNCFASIETALNPALRGRPVAVCGNPAERRGIVLAKSEQAKRRGVATGDPLWRARQKCPDICLVTPHYDVYKTYSEQIRQYYSRLTPLVEPFGLDECWLDITGIPDLAGNPPKSAEKIRADIRRIFKITVSVGISFNKVFAKLGSDMNKPDGITEIPFSSFRQKIWHLPAAALLCVGRASSAVLQHAGILTIGQIARSDPKFMQQLLGKNGKRLWQWANGMDDEPVHEYGYRPPRLSLGHGTTLPEDARSASDLWPVIAALSERTAFGLQEEETAGRGIQITVRDALLQFHQYQMHPMTRLETSADISRHALMLLAQNYPWTLPVHAFGIRIFQLCGRHDPIQPDLFRTARDDTEIRSRNLAADAVVAQIQAKYGKTALMRGFQLDVPAIQPSAFPSAVRVTR